MPAKKTTTEITPITTTIKPDPKPGNRRAVRVPAVKGKNDKGTVKAPLSAERKADLSEQAAREVVANGLADILSAPSAAAAEAIVDATLAAVAPVTDPTTTSGNRARALDAAEASALRDSDVDLSGAPAKVAKVAPAAKAPKAPKAPISVLDAAIAKHATGELASKKKLLAAILSGPDGAEVGQRIMVIGALQQDDPEAFGRSCAALAGFFWNLYRSEG